MYERGIKKNDKILIFILNHARQMISAMLIEKEKIFHFLFIPLVLSLTHSLYILN